MMQPLGYVEVDLDALAANYAKLARAAVPGTCGAVVKADAYGLGVAAVARRLAAAGCTEFFVATPAEGAELRRILPDVAIIVMEGLCGNEREAFLAASLVPVINTPADFAAWGNAGPMALHIDTGMNRLGLSEEEAQKIHTGMAAGEREKVRYLMTHLACADEPAHPLNRLQLDRFASFRECWPAARTSIGNSAGLLLGNGFASDVARPGIALYGANPFVEGENPMAPVVKLRARILKLHDVAPGETVGYGASFVAESPRRVATVGIGYADGYLRSLGNCGIAEVARLRVPVVGRVSMDLVCLDVTDVPRADVAEGGWATMIGGSVSLEELAALAGTINYELLTSLGHRLERRYLGGI